MPATEWKCVGFLQRKIFLKHGSLWSPNFLLLHRVITTWGRTWMVAGMLSVGQIDVAEPLLVSSSSDINGSVLNNTIVQENCSLHVRGNLLGSLTIEPGATVVVEGSVDGKIINRGGSLVVNNKGLAACITFDGPAEAEACGILKINLTAIASKPQWEFPRLCRGGRKSLTYPAVDTAAPSTKLRIASRQAHEEGFD
jgi:hypothetical protein